MTTIYVDSRKRVAGLDSDFEVDLGSRDRGRYLYWVDAALGTLNWALLPEGAYTGSRLDQLQLRYCRLQRDHEQQPPHSERSGAAAAVP